MGWNRAVESARIAEVHVLTHDEGNELEVRRAVREQGLRHLYVHFIPHTPFERALMRLPGGYYLGYRRWQRRAYHRARAWHRRTPFDLAHQVNMCGYREPGELWRLGIPFVWGPVGGTQNTPPAFLRSGGLGLLLGEGLRNTLNRIQLRLSPRVRRAAREADVVLAANSTGQRDLTRVVGTRPRRLLETGVRRVGMPKRWAERAPGPFRLLWAGELVERKGIHLALAAMARLREAARHGGPQVELVVAGDGPERAAVRAAEGVDWRGWIAREELLSLYADADALAFTSLRDTSGNVMLEALAAGLPVVYLDHQGAADIGSTRSGVPVPVTTPEAAIAGLTDAVTRLASDPSLYDACSRGAIQRASELHWRSNGDTVNALYANLLGLSPSDRGDGRPRSRPSRYA